jgi:hypothetical protein
VGALRCSANDRIESNRTYRAGASRAMALSFGTYVMPKRNRVREAGPSLPFVGPGSWACC